MSSKFKSTFLAIFVAAFMVVGFGLPANADLAAVGPVNQVTGFPVWFQENAITPGLSLGLCDVPGEAEAPPCGPELLVVADGFVAGNIVEALYYGAEAIFNGPNGEQFLAICAVEAAGGAPDSVSNVALIRLRGLTVAGDYTITTPCGTFEGTIVDPLVDDEIRDEIAVIGFPGTVPDFVGTLPGPVQLFASNGTGVNVGPGFIGDGLTPAALEGPLFPGGGTIFEVSGPAGVGTVSTDQFVVVGKVFALAPVASPTPPVNFTRDATGAGTLVFEIPAPAGATTAEVVGVVGQPLPGGVAEPFALTLTAGVFTGSITIVATDVLPANVEVTFNLGLVGESVQTLPVTDKIVGFIAGVADPATNPTIVENAAGGLTISAASSNQWGQGVDDGSLMPTLTVTDSATDAVLGTIPGSGGTLDIAAPGPAQVTITSVAAAGAVDPAGGTITLNNPGITPPPAGGGIVGGGGGGGGCFIADLLGW